MVLASGDMSNSSVALRNAIKIETLTDPVTPVEAILQRCPKHGMLLQVIYVHIITEVYYFSMPRKDLDFVDTHKKYVTKISICILVWDIRL